MNFGDIPNNDYYIKTRYNMFMNTLKRISKIEQIKTG